jgi:hypothetical protein
MSILMHLMHPSEQLSRPGPLARVPVQQLLPRFEDLSEIIRTLACATTAAAALHLAEGQDHGRHSDDRIVLVRRGGGKMVMYICIYAKGYICKRKKDTSVVSRRPLDVSSAS